MIDLDQLIVDCSSALADPRPQPAVREVLERIVATPGDVEAVIPAPRQQMSVLHVSETLTIFQTVNAPGFHFHAHDHGFWSAVAFYAGAEQDTFFRRSPDGLVESGVHEYRSGDVAVLGTRTVHATVNPLRSYNAAILVFAGNPFSAPCSQWDPQTLEESPFDRAYAQAVYPPAPIPGRGQLGAGPRV